VRPPPSHIPHRPSRVRLASILSLLLALPIAALAADPADLRFNNPLASPDNRYIALANENCNGVYLYDTTTGSYLQITDAPSSGYAYNWSHDSSKLGFKLLISVGDGHFQLQMPVVFDINRKELISLHAAVPHAGVPSFSADGRIAFTVDKELRIVNANGTLQKTLPLNHYANLAPISPDGTQAAYNGPEGHIWVIELATGEKKQLTSETCAHFNPVWSSDSRKLAIPTISGRLKSIEIASGQVFELGQGLNPSWSPDSDTIFYSNVEQVDSRKEGRADICCVRYTGGNVTRLIEQAGKYKTCARISTDGRHLTLISSKNGKVCRAAVAKTNGPQTPRNQYTVGKPVQVGGESITLEIIDTALPETDTQYPDTAASPQSQVLVTGTVPYLHQVYDTPDDFNGHWACGASSAMMAVNYYDVLDYWDVTCSTPYSHVSHYGQYVSEIYTYNGYTYDIRSKDASNNWAYGGYGYIVQNNWEDTKGHMRDYVNNHGLSSAVDWSPTWSKLQTEVNNNHPFILLNSLTTAGHYITTLGYFDNQHTVIVNDPYGNKNTTGYPSYDGAGVYYDWPGYNNGYQNLNTVWCFIYCRGDLAPTITQQPTDQSVYLTQTASFHVEAEGEGTLTYQWQKKEGETFTDLSNGGHCSGVGSDTLVVSDVAAETEGLYRCTVSNAGGSTYSDEASLTIKPNSPGDLDGDGDVDLEDFAVFQVCLSGAHIPQDDPACAGAKMEGDDNDVDNQDLAKFMGCISGAGIPGDVNCLEPN